MSDKNWQLIEGPDILNRRIDEAQTTSDYEPILTISEGGVPILESVGDVVMPANYSFECINNFVHCESPMYEDLQNLALGMAGRIALLESEAEQLRMSVHNARIELESAGNGAWTSVKNRLPKERGAYIVYHHWYPEKIRIVNFGTSTKWENGRDKLRPPEHRITHWMPLPSSPQMKGQA